MKNKVLGFAGIIAVLAIPAFAEKSMLVTVPVPEGGATLMYVLLAGVSCFGVIFFHSRNQPVKR